MGGALFFFLLLSQSAAVTVLVSSESQQSSILEPSSVTKWYLLVFLLLLASNDFILCITVLAESLVTKCSKCLALIPNLVQCKILPFSLKKIAQLYSCYGSLKNKSCFSHRLRNSANQGTWSQHDNSTSQHHIAIRFDLVTSQGPI